LDLKAFAISQPAINALKRLQTANPNNASLVVEYIREQHGLGWKPAFKNKCVFWPYRLSKLTGHKNFQELIEQDIQSFTLYYNKGEIETDPKHHWIGTYNQAQIHTTKFLKFVFFPNMSHKKRPRPDLLRNYDQLHRQEESVVEPRDVWTNEDHAIFIKYCNDPRDKALHMAFRDTGARPHELLNLKIGDIDFNLDGDTKHVEFIIGYGGKTGPRSATLTDSLPYIMEWLGQHPQRHNKNATLFCSEKTGGKLHPDSVNDRYKKYRKRLTKLYQSFALSEQDRIAIGRLLSKPFNQYNQRHSAITEHVEILSSDAISCDCFGWKQGSRMVRRYRHLKGNEARNQILKHKGIIKEEQIRKNILAPKVCPLAGCRTSNSFDALKCSACGYIFSFEERKRIKEQEDQAKKQSNEEFQTLKDQLLALTKQVSALTEKNQNNIDDYKREKGWVKDKKPEMLLIKDGTRVNRIAVEAELG
jgi:integrase/recombinase XerD